MKKLLGLLLFAVIAAARAEDIVDHEISAWQPGMLDIHQISTGRGNAGLYIFPDGTTLLVDTGELPEKTPRHTPDRPDGSRCAGEWVTRYIQYALRHDAKPSLDYALLTHFHEDHMGAVGPNSPASETGEYKLTGLTFVGTRLRIGKMIDRGFPDYKYPAPTANKNVANYCAFVKWQSEHNGMKVERFVPGRNDQVVLRRDRAKYSNFEVRNIGANGEIWTGVGTETRQHFPVLDTVPKPEWPNENMCSISFRLSYGKFDFFNGGDTQGLPAEGLPMWHDVETPVAQAVGPVDAAILDHHGYVDSQNAFFIGALRPRVWTLSTWDAGHPTERVWQRLQSRRIYTGARDIFATDLHPATEAVIGGISKMASKHGHIVIRVSPGGKEFRVVIVDDTSESHRVTAVFGPYECR